MKADSRFLTDVTQFAPSLKTVVETAGLDPGRICAAIKIAPDRKMELTDRHQLFLHDGTKHAEWRVESLRELFRGTQAPPPDIHKYPPEYTPLFFFMEQHAITACEALGDQTDNEFEECYANLRRRPDGRRLGVLHDFLWQVAALMLGKFPVSQAEFEGVLGTLSRSAQHWQFGPVSRNYIAYVRKSLSALHR